ncbi:pyridine nucleotide-disulfide oxidoreductase [Roseivirga pacifica]|uniref:Pyridine nucleotide-disulphide oxidoreductase n=1 Tax=Roseivirga pacifica TaxID=1267423 RepID=A0A1I0MDU5_9BACT|nr:FAD-dependent oxidoreductase [Roseivirga pacifica]RKQ50300.1 pyridine nucleotide-disulfide oxidoreductase [Roseivirga pacifica]SEV86298.1 Pyridine nucleotide-disulphide oxidoreductase [Roseivirga pacifica]
MEHIVIIGNGISGITAARHVRKLSDHKITVISAETDHFFSRTALMYIYMGHMKYEHTKPYEDWFWEKNRIELKRGYVERVNTNAKLLTFVGGETMPYDKLVLATGSTPNKFGWPGQELKGVQGLYSYQDLQMMEANTKNIQRAVVVGGGLIGIEMAEMLLSRNIPVTFLVRENSFWNNVLPKEESEMINRHIREHHVDLRLAAELDEIIGDENGGVKGVRTKTGEEIACQFVGLTVGVSPNVNFLRDSGVELNRGVLVDEFLQTNIADVYAAGDCAEFRKPNGERRPIEQVWYTGRMMGETLARTLCGRQTAYQPGHWFNSAKFFDIEYQTYGWVWPQAKDTEGDFYWEEAGGKICLRLRWDKASRKLTGVNNFGFRLRHHAFDKWFDEGRTVDYVLEHLRDANFDPELYKTHETAILEQFNRENGTSLRLKKKSWKRILDFVS